MTPPDPSGHFHALTAELSGRDARCLAKGDFGAALDQSESFQAELRKAIFQRQ